MQFMPPKSDKPINFPGMSDDEFVAKLEETLRDMLEDAGEPVTINGRTCLRVNVKKFMGD